MYRKQEVDIMLNGNKAGNYIIRNGVKQGDALSCILFIICIEPLIRNIKENDAIECIRSRLLNVNIPKIYSFADDVSVLTKRSETSIRKIFKEYENFLNSSGLILNADKTELLCFNKKRNHNFEIDVDYRGTRHRLVALDRVKINGIWLLQDPKAREDVNVQMRMDSTEKILKMWSTIQLSLLGRILIIKTFAISQFVFLLQSMKIWEPNLKKVERLFFKYLWNRNFSGNRAPERLKRSIMLTPMKYGGFGLMDIRDLSASLDLRSLGRTLTSTHPLFGQINDSINRHIQKSQIAR